ncbi:trem-like transcript 1 protein [Molossus molossus]|uniref:Triggering receptor expressed on myeloid cells like 1 n=1 Tax=Molossus molossus TaxID=27622 RepID=A0A7J8GU54_MOLMO|nr:trem-like transcript 1 protein [Molossus molossus]KAF6463438.1 triggering receptor expressed on myeloid cells like 1 [Molossus molossus]
MGLSPLLLLLLGLAGQGSADSLPEVLRAPVGSSIRVQCLYRPHDLRARKVWCRFSQGWCQPLVSSVVDRGAPGHSRTFLTDMGSGLLQVEMVSLREEDAGEYRCMVEGSTGSQTVHRVSLDILPEAPGLKEEKHPSSDPTGTASPPEPSLQQHSILLIWGSVALLGLLVVAVVLFDAMAKRKGNRLGVSGRSQDSGVPGMAPSSGDRVDSAGPAADAPLEVPHVRLNRLPSFDDITYTSLPPEPLSRKPPPPAPSSVPPLPPKVLTHSKSVTYATVNFHGGDRGGGAC